MDDQQIRAQALDAAVAHLGPSARESQVLDRAARYATWITTGQRPAPEPGSMSGPAPPW